MSKKIYEKIDSGIEDILDFVLGEAPVISAEEMDAKQIYDFTESMLKRVTLKIKLKSLVELVEEEKNKEFEKFRDDMSETNGGVKLSISNITY